MDDIVEEDECAEFDRLIADSEKDYEIIDELEKLLKSHKERYPTLTKDWLTFKI